MSKSNGKQQNLFDIIEGFDAAMLTTLDKRNGLRARPMAVAKLNRDGAVYFLTDAGSPKVGEIENNSKVTVTFQSGWQFATLSGKAEIIDNRSLIGRVWKDSYKTWFPKGQDDPNLKLIRVEPQEAEYWDNAGTQGVKYAVEAIRAFVSGERPNVDPDQHAKVKM
jgi:general stress protein 26